MSFHSLSSPVKFWTTVASATLAVLAFFGIYLFGVYYVYENWGLAAEARQKLSDLEKRRSEASAAGHVLENLASQRRLIESSFIDTTNPLPLFESIENLGRRFGVSVKLDQVSAPAKDVDEYLISASGKFGAVSSVIKGLESLPFLVELGSAEIANRGSAFTTEGKAVSEPIVDLKMRLRTVAP